MRDGAQEDFPRRKRQNRDVMIILRFFLASFPPEAAAKRHPYPKIHKEAWSA